MFYKYPKWLSAAILGFLIIVALSAYFKVFNAEFVYDDFGFIVNNKDIQSFSPISKFLLSPNIFTGSNYASENSGGRNWRPVASFAFAVEYSVFGKNPSGFHFVSILLHILNLILVYFLVIKITKRIGVAALATLFWSLHPTSTEAVSWITNQSSLIFFGFFLLAALAILKYKDNRNKKFFIQFSYLFFILSLLTKETALGGIFVIPFIFLIVSDWNEKTSSEQSRINFRRVLTDSTPFVLIGLAYFYAHYKIVDALGDHVLRGSFFQNILLAPTVFYKYISLAIYPVNLLLNYANYQLPTGIFDPRVIAGVLLLIISALFIYFGISAKGESASGGKKSWFNFSFGIIWFLAFLSPVMQIIPFQDIIGERFLYAPILGFFLAVILGFDNLLSYIKSKFNWNFYPIAKTIIAIVLIVFFILTFNRNNDWLNSLNLWNSVLRIDPNNEKALNNLAAYYVNNNQASKVIEFSERLLKINPEDITANLNMGVGLAIAGKFKEAELRFLYVLSKKPDYQPALVSLSVLYQSTGRYNQSLEILKKLNLMYPDREDIKQHLLQLENIVKYNDSLIKATEGGQYPYIESEVQAPAVEGNIINSGISGRVALASGAPFEASLDIFSDQGALITSIRTHSDGTFQIPLRPGSYILKPMNPDGPIAPILTSYPFNIGSGQWLQIKIEYK